MIEDTTPCSVEITEDDDIIKKRHHEKYGVATAKFNPFSINGTKNISEE